MGKICSEKPRANHALEPEALRSRVRRIGGAGGVYVQVQHESGGLWRIAIAVWIVGFSAGGGELAPDWRLGKLPDFGERCAAGLHWDLRKRAARRRRAGIIRDPEDEIVSAGRIMKITRGADEAATLFGNFDA